MEALKARPLTQSQHACACVCVLGELTVAIVHHPQDARIENQALVTDALVAVAAEVRENVQLRRAAG